MIHFKIEEDGILTDSILGGFSVNLREIVENPGQWLSGYFEIQQIQYKENEEIIKSNGHCGIMVQFRPENKPADFDTKEPELENYEQMIERGKPVTEPGILYVNVIGARKIPDSTFDTPDAFVTIKCSKGNKKEIKTKTIHDNLSPVWDHKDQIELDLPKEQYEHFQLFITLYDYNYTINSNLGKIDLDISHLFVKPGEWLNQILPILDKKGFPGAGELYLQIQWVPNSQKNSIKTEAPEHLFLKEKKEQDEKIKQQEAEKQKEAQEPDVEGTIFVKVIQAFNLSEGAKTDGKVTIKVNKGSNQIFNTKEIKNNQNPEFQQEFNIEIKARPKDIKSGLALSATVEDIDFIGNDFLGFLEVDLSNYIQNPNLWFNEISQLSDAKGQVGKNGMLYLQIQWRPKGIQNQNTELPKLRSIKEYQKGADPKGIVVVKVVKATNILGVEKKGSYSDAKLRIKFNKQKETTKIIKSLNPEWNEQFQFKINFRERSEMPFAQCEILDNNTFSDTFLGDFEANISEILDEPNIWKIKKEYTLANMEKQKTKGDISGTAELWFAFVQNEKDIANLK
ncbi:C2 domain [Pseudocohnilembus persalinus]|uniref:C2 domain n=1 Tax=Pseudocohnilembus persalinus TaxID=266149 RepID=A0A0V0QUB0_PSEPJ|nr:C2 domain [Pseudocohnilembus persalinus]|eukprot:KRX05860.1 C2 domain [Pseudocohnilembus persalinus]